MSDEDKAARRERIMRYLEELPTMPLEKREAIVLKHIERAERARKEPLPMHMWHGPLQEAIHSLIKKGALIAEVRLRIVPMDEDDEDEEAA